LRRPFSFLEPNAGGTYYPRKRTRGEVFRLKATGIVRRIDDLGRIVIPIEIRRDMNIRDGDPLEIFVEKNGEVILKKYSAIGELGPFGQSIVNSLHETTGFIAVLTDRDEAVAVAGGAERDYVGRAVGAVVLRAMDNRETLVFTSRDHAHPGSAIGDRESCIFSSEVVAPVVVGGDPVGAVILGSTDPNAVMGELEQKIAQSAAGFLARHMQE
jgi:AbrB family transcriptional regulator (stage V sporulation protein T)